ncbi:MAG TPA: hypothetical protein VEX62_01810 [Candidatus Limnocylindrales bacterium]|nr:hypothetical protein [Candidatus Limnocylindrales bacterium]
MGEMALDQPLRTIHRLEGETVEVEVLPTIGARLHRLRVFGHDLMRTPDDISTHLDDPFYWGGYHMLPWTNRIAARPTLVGSGTVDLAANFKDGTAIHGLHYATPWDIDEVGSYSVSGGGNESGWPWPYTGRVEIRVEGSSVRVRHAVTNLSDEPMPAGVGIHPWFRTPVEVRVPARVAIASNTDAQAPHEPLSADLDFRVPRELPTGLDAAWTDVDQPCVELRWPHLDISAELRASAPTVYVVAARPDNVDAVAVEPQTHAPWGLRRLLDDERGGLDWLPPNTTLTLDSELTFRRAAKEPT